jgi:hypothetical protein
MEVHLGQYFLLTSLLERWRTDDPDGNYILETTITPWVPEEGFPPLGQFDRSYVAMSSSKQAWATEGHMKMVFCDGTFTTSGKFKHTLLFAVTMDGNNQILLLAFAAVDVENESNWVWFTETLIGDFPGIEVFQSDADKGITSHTFQELLSQHQIRHGRCVKHMFENCRTKIGQTLSQPVRDKIMGMAKAYTREQYDCIKSHLVSLKDKAAAAAAEWFDSRRDDFATHGVYETKFSMMKDTVVFCSFLILYCHSFA